VIRRKGNDKLRRSIGCEDRRDDIEKLQLGRGFLLLSVSRYFALRALIIAGIITIPRERKKSEPARSLNRNLEEDTISRMN